VQVHGVPTIAHASASLVANDADSPTHDLPQWHDLGVAGTVTPCRFRVIILTKC